MKNNISFEEVDATAEEGRLKLIRLSKQPKTPFLYVKHRHSISTVVGSGEFQYVGALDTSLSYEKFMKAKKSRVEEGQRTL
jgi:ribosomal protein L7Ae-like RNA K-turn-binding protein